jgi:hypothetical protein
MPYERSIRAEAAFRERVAELGGTPAWEFWQGVDKPHQIICREGHVSYPYPGYVLWRNGGICRTCAKQDPGAAEQGFRKRLAELGATPAWDEWLGARKPHRVICKDGHECWPRPDGIRRGRGPCSVCAGNDPATAEKAFRECLAELGATPAWTQWQGTGKPCNVICKEGHECSPRPSNVLRGGGLCRICAGRDPATAEAAFRKRLAELGAAILWTEWLGARTGHRVRCAAGHECWPRPDDLRAGTGICRVCVGHDPATAEGACRERLKELGATPAWNKWLGAGEPHRVICRAGHECWPRPSGIQRGGGPCNICAGNDPTTVEAACKERLAELGATPAWTEWHGAANPHKIICKNGHECWPTPNAIQQGRGPCRFCMGKEWDVFYVVINDTLGIVKFGITSGDPAHRLKTHRRSGYRRAIFLTTRIEALPVEDRTRVALAKRGYQPVQGREYFALEALEIILETVKALNLMNELEVEISRAA